MRKRNIWVRKSFEGLLGTVLMCSLVVAPIPVLDVAMAAKKPKKVKLPKFEDNCKPLRKPFESIENYQTNQILKGAVTGAIAGALLGVLEQAVKKDRVVVDQYGRAVRVKQENNIAEYAIAGAIGGGLVGYLTSIEKNRENRAELQAALGKFDAERSQYSQLPQALADLGNCRNIQVFTVQQQFEAQLIDDKEATKRLDLIDKWVVKDDEVIAKASKSENESIRTYAQANAVADGVSAEEAKQSPDSMIARYANGADKWQGVVELDDNVEAASSVNMSLAAMGGSVAPPAPVESGPPLPVVKMVYVSAGSGANVRSEPRASSPMLGSAARGTELPVRDTNTPGWVGVIFDGKDGFISRTLVADSASAAAAQPTRVAAKAPRPGAAPTRIRYRAPRLPQTNQASRVAQSIGVGGSIRIVNAERQQSYTQQMGASRLSVSRGRAER